MKILSFEDHLGSGESSVLTIGNFDGVHCGHQILIQEVVKRAEVQNISSVIITFEPHTRLALFPELPQNLLTTFEEKVALINRLGIDYLMKIPFDRSFSEYTPEKFVEHVLIEKLNATEWVMGEGHAVGKDRAGGKKFLRDAMRKYHINMFTTDLMSRGKVTISSTQIRKYITEGRIVEAVEMLGHPYLISAERISGLKIGSQLGYPTLNFQRPPSQKVIPPPGVYAAELEFDGSVLSGALYFGDCPTFSDRDIHFEFHALHLSEKLPQVGENAHIWLYKFIRADREFDGPGKLVEQIKQDVNDIRKFFSEEKRQWR